MTASRPRAPRLTGKWPLLVGVGGLIAVVAFLAAGGRGCRQSTQAASRSLLDCMERGDSGCLLAYIGEEERKKGGVDGRSLDEFVHRVWKPFLRGFEPHVRARQFESGPSHGDMAELRHQDGRRVPLVAFAVQADSRAIHPNLVLDMTTTALLSQRRAEQPLPQGAALEAFLAQELRTRLADFESSGLKGATVPIQGTGRSRYYTWKELADRFQKRADLFRSLPEMSQNDRAAALADYKEWERAGS